MHKRVTVGRRFHPKDLALLWARLRLRMFRSDQQQESETPIHLKTLKVRRLLKLWHLQLID